MNGQNWSIVCTLKARFQFLLVMHHSSRDFLARFRSLRKRPLQHFWCSRSRLVANILECQFLFLWIQQEECPTSLLPQPLPTLPPPVPPHTHEHHSHNNVMLSLLSVLERHFPFLAFEAVKRGGNVSQLQHHGACDNERNTHKSETTYLWLFAVYSRKSAAPSFRPQTLKYNYIERILSKMFVGSF